MQNEMNICWKTKIHIWQPKMTVLVQTDRGDLSDNPIYIFFLIISVQQV